MSPWLIIAFQEGQYSLKPPESKKRNDPTWCVFTITKHENKQLCINIFSRPRAVNVSTTKNYSTVAAMLEMQLGNLKCVPWKIFMRMHKVKLCLPRLANEQSVNESLSRGEIIHNLNVCAVFWNTSAYLT